MAEIRLDDRPYAAGDELHLREFDPLLKRYTGLEAHYRVTSVLRNVVGLKRGYCLMSIRPAWSGINTIFNAAAAGTRARNRKKRAS